MSWPLELQHGQCERHRVRWVKWVSSRRAKNPGAVVLREWPAYAECALHAIASRLPILCSHTLWKLQIQATRRCWRMSVSGVSSLQALIDAFRISVHVCAQASHPSTSRWSAWPCDWRKRWMHRAQFPGHSLRRRGWARKHSEAPDGRGSTVGLHTPVRAGTPALQERRTNRDGGILIHTDQLYAWCMHERSGLGRGFQHGTRVAGSESARDADVRRAASGPSPWPRCEKTLCLVSYWRYELVCRRCSVFHSGSA
jgi:hypothetical protein